MSHIFDALQRAEDERRGVTNSSRRPVTELLERAEHQVRQPNPGTRVATILETALANGEARPRAARPAAAADAHAKAEPLRTEPPAFQSLHLQLPIDYRLVALSDQSSPASEAFRLLTVRLRHLRKERPLTTLLISSTSPEEGKSFSAANLACTLAAGQQQNVLLVDGDVRRASQEKIFGLQPVPGLCEYLQGKRKLAEIIYRLDEAGIWLLPAGQKPGNELTESARLTSMVTQLSRWFDWVIIDSPPVLPLADTSVWEKMADGVLLVARRGVTAKHHLKRGTEAVDQSKLIGAILNSSTRSGDEDYYHYYRRPSAEPESEEALQP